MLAPEAPALPPAAPQTMPPQPETAKSWTAAVTEEPAPAAGRAA